MKIVGIINKIPWGLTPPSTPRGSTKKARLRVAISVQGTPECFCK